MRENAEERLKRPDPWQTGAVVVFKDGITTTEAHRLLGKLMDEGVRFINVRRLRGLRRLDRQKRYSVCSR